MLVIQGLIKSLVLIHYIVKRAYSTNLSSKNSLILDISGVVSKGFKVEHRSYPDATYFVYTPNTRYNVEKVVDAGKYIWAPEKDEKCVNIHAFSKEKRWLVLRIIIADEGFLHDRFYENKAGDWIPINEGDYKVRLGQLQILPIIEFARPLPLTTEPPESVSPSYIIQQTNERVVKTIIEHSETEICKNGNFITLDINNVDLRNFDRFVTSPHGLNISVFTPLSGYTLSKIVDGGNSICENAHGYTSARISVHKDKISILHLYTIDSNNAELSHYFVNVVGWKSVNADEFYRTFHTLVVGKITFKEVDLKIDDNKVKPEFVCFNHSEKYPSRICLPNPGYTIKSVKVGRNTIWSKKTGEENCISASLYPRETPALAHLVISTSSKVEELFYSKNGGSWREVDKDGYILKLQEGGISLEGTDRNVTFDISRQIDTSNFVLHKIGTKSPSVSIITPFPGNILTRIVEGDDTIWEASGDEYCVCFWFCLPEKSGMSYALVTDPGKERTVYYFLKNEKWESVSKSEYFAKYLLKIVPNFSDDRIVNAPIKESYKGRVITSSFKNRQGLRLRSYAIRADDPKATLIITSGTRGHLISGFFPYNLDWNFDRFGYQIPPNITSIILMRTSQPLNTYFNLDNVAKYKHLFEYASMDGVDAFDLLPQFQYEGSFLQFLNMMGYSICALEQQSHGLSESISDLRCYANDPDDLVYDLLQFVSIVKRGKFSDPNETYDERTIFQSMPTDKKLILLGFSLGSNVVLRAAQIFNVNAKPGNKLADGLIGISSTLNVDKLLGRWSYCRCLLKSISKTMDTRDNWVENILNYGESVYIFMRYNDPWFFIKKLSFKIGYVLFESADRANSNAQNYPKDLPILFIHSTDDLMCDIKGPTEFKSKLPNHAIKVEETSGCGHFITDALVSPIINPMIDNWVDGLSGIAPRSAA